MREGSERGERNQSWEVLSLFKILLIYFFILFHPPFRYKLGAKKHEDWNTWRPRVSNVWRCHCTTISNICLPPPLTPFAYRKKSLDVCSSNFLNACNINFALFGRQSITGGGIRFFCGFSVFGFVFCNFFFFHRLKFRVSERMHLLQLENREKSEVISFFFF